MTSTTRSLRRFLRFRPRRSGGLLAPTVAVLVALAIGGGLIGLSATSWAPDQSALTAGRFARMAGPPSPDAGAGPADAIPASASRLEAALGLAAAAGRGVVFVDDLLRGRRLRETRYLDRAGSPIGVVRLGADGRLVSAVRLGYRAEFARGRLDDLDAMNAAARLVDDIGIALPSGVPSVRPMLDGTLWAVAWPRRVAGALVDEDGVTVRLWKSGHLHSVTVSERPLDRPVAAMDAERSGTILAALLPHLVARERLADAVVGTPSLHWVAANDMFRPGAPGAAATPTALRLAWVFELRFGGASAAFIRSVAVWIDAESGALLGGDVIQ